MEFQPSTSLRREQLIAAARLLFEEKGLAKTNIQDITRHIGVSRSLFYHYFQDKEAIISAVLDDYISEYLEALHYWNENRREQTCEQSLSHIVKLLKNALFNTDAFRESLVSQQNASLYIEFVSRVAEQTAKYLINSTVREYQMRHEIKIAYPYETLYILILGIIGLIRKYPDMQNEVIEGLIIQTLHMDHIQLPEVVPV